MSASAGGLVWREAPGLGDTPTGVPLGLGDALVLAAGVCSVDSGMRLTSCISRPDASVTVGEGGVLGVGTVDVLSVVVGAEIAVVGGSLLSSAPCDGSSVSSEPCTGFVSVIAVSSLDPVPISSTPCSVAGC